MGKILYIGMESTVFLTHPLFSTLRESTAPFSGGKAAACQKGVLMLNLNYS